MQVSITGKQLDVSDAFRERAEQRLIAVVSKYFGDAIEGHVTVSRQSHLFRADCSVHVGHGIFVQGHGDGADAYASFEDAASRVEKQLRRYKRRLRNHHSKQRQDKNQAIQAQSYVLASDEETPEVDERDDYQPVIVAETTTEVPSCTVGEAVMRMDLAALPVMLFHNSAHGGINVVYRRVDGNIGWIDPKDSQG